MPDSNGNFTNDDLIAIRQAIASGALRVEYNDRTVVYRSMSDLKEAEQKILRALGKKKRFGRLLAEGRKGTC